jgi:hypothetical protein
MEEITHISVIPSVPFKDHSGPDKWAEEVLAWQDIGAEYISMGGYGPERSG